VHKGEPQDDRHRHTEHDQDAPADRWAKGAERIRQVMRLPVPVLGPCCPRDVEVRVRQVVNGDLEGRHQC
jgi:hypothetical protein